VGGLNVCLLTYLFTYLQNRIDGRVGIPEPEEKREHGPWDWTDGGRTPAGHDVDDEEADPHSAETRDYNRHAHGSSHLPLFTEEATETGPAAKRQDG